MTTRLCAATQKQILEMSQEYSVSELSEKLHMEPWAISQVLSEQRETVKAESRKARYFAARRQGFNREKAMEIVGCSRVDESALNHLWNKQFTTVKVSCELTGEVWITKLEKGRSLRFEVEEIPII